MTVARITEISSISAISFEDAVKQGIERANKTLKNVKGAWIKDQEVTVDKGMLVRPLTAPRPSAALRWNWLAARRWMPCCGIC